LPILYTCKQTAITFDSDLPYYSARILIGISYYVINPLLYLL
jgi:hypothetical protein